MPLMQTSTKVASDWLSVRPHACPNASARHTYSLKASVQPLAAIFAQAQPSRSESSHAGVVEL